MPYVKIQNTSRTRLLFSDFRGGDNGVPFDTAWIEPGQSAELETGKFSTVSIGAQAQEGGRWLGGDPAEEPTVNPGQTLTFTISRDIA